VLSDVDALFTKDPARHPDAELVREVGDLSDLGRYEIGMSSSHLGSGGMRSKVLAAEMATAAGVPVVICNGTRAGTLVSALSDQHEGTRFEAQTSTVSSFKLWLKYAKMSRGRVVVDEGAERALREQGTSLLPVGVVEVEGDFEAGDAIDVATLADGGRSVGKGISNYSAEELRRVKGLKSAQVRELLPRASEEAVHRDYFVLG
jgi:glutamate 5-kinase